MTDGNRIGLFYRTVPNDAIQAPTVANYITKKLNATRVYIIDDQEIYSQGLADGVQALLRAKGVNVTRDSISQQATDFSSNIAKIPGNTQVVYTPWQLSPQAQTFGQQLKAAGKGGISMFGSDGLFSRQWKITGSYVSFFPVDTSSRSSRRSRRRRRRRRVLRGSQLRRGPGRDAGGHQGVRRRQGNPRGGP